MHSMFHNLLTILALCAPLCGYAQTRVNVPKAGTLAQLLTQAQQDTCTALTLRGEINSKDLRVLRRRAGYQEGGMSTGQLEHLDLDACRVKGCKTLFVMLDAKEGLLAGAYKVTTTRRYNEQGRITRS